MQVIIHAGVHETEEDRLMKTLLRNSDVAAERGIAIPGPSTYRSLLNECIDAALSAGQSPQSGEILWDAILEQDHAERVILSSPHFFGAPRQAMDIYGFYPEAEKRIGVMQKLFPQDRLALHLALRDPASFLPAILQRGDPQRRQAVLDDFNPLSLRWSNLLLRLRTALPDVEITVWAYEDMPLIWGQIIRRMLGLSEQERISGGMDLLSAIMTGEGMKRLRVYLHEHRDMGEAHKQRVFAAFLSKYAIEEAIEEEVDLPGWTEPLMAELSRRYDADLEEIAAIPGVTLLPG